MKSFRPLLLYFFAVFVVVASLTAHGCTAEKSYTFESHECTVQHYGPASHVRCERDE